MQIPVLFQPTAVYRRSQPKRPSGLPRCCRVALGITGRLALINREAPVGLGVSVQWLKHDRDDGAGG